MSRPANRCGSCQGVRAADARRSGIVEKVRSRTCGWISKRQRCPTRLRCRLTCARKRTPIPCRRAAAGTRTGFAIGWDERALHDANRVACLFHFTNGFAGGHGTAGDPAVFGEHGRQLAEGGYEPLRKLLE